MQQHGQPQPKQSSVEPPAAVAPNLTNPYVLPRLSGNLDQREVVEKEEGKLLQQRLGRPPSVAVEL